MADKVICDKSDLVNVADAIRSKLGVTDTYYVSELSPAIQSIQTGVELPTLSNPGSASDLLSGKELIDQDGNKVTGNIPTKTSSDLTSSGATVTVPTGYYASSASKSVSTATQATPTISVDSSGLITASATQSAGYVSSGTKTATQQLTTKAAETITPSTSDQTIASGIYLTGVQTIKGDSSLIADNIKSGTSIFGVTGTYEGSGGNFKVEFGSFTPASDSGKSGYTVTHSLGTKPLIIAYYTSTSVGQHYNKAGASIAGITSGAFINNNNGIDALHSGPSEIHGDPNVRYGTTCFAITSADTTSFKIGRNRNYTSSVGCKAGVTYYWVAMAE